MRARVRRERPPTTTSAAQNTVGVALHVSEIGQYDVDGAGDSRSGPDRPHASLRRGPLLLRDVLDEPEPQRMMATLVACSALCM